MKILIFGGGGFIGSHLLVSLTRDNEHDIVAYDIDFSKYNRLNRDMGKVKLIRGNIRKEDNANLKQLVSSNDLIIDLLAYANPSIYVSEPCEVVRLNLFDNLRIVEACVEFGRYVIQFSSCEVYGMAGGSTEPFSEDRSNLLLGPIEKHRWIYSCAKQMLERIIHAYGLKQGLNYTIIRPFNFVGPEMDYILERGDEGIPRVFPQFMSAILFNRDIKLVDGGRNFRTFTYIDDSIDAIKIIIRNIDHICNRKIINIGTPENEIRICDLATLMMQIFEKITGRKANCHTTIVSGEEFYGKGYQDCDRRIPDIGRLMALGWRPRYQLKDLLELSIRYYVNMYSNRIGL